MKAALLILGTVCLAIRPGRCGNLAPTAGQLGGSLGAGAAVAAERSAFGRNPAALRPGQAGCHLGFHRPFGLEDLAVAEAGAFADGTRWGTAFAWRQTGAEALYRERALDVTQTFRLAGGNGRFPGVLDAGGSWTAWGIEMPGRKAGYDWSQGFGVAWRMLPRFKAGAFALGLPLADGGPSHFDRILQWGLEASSGAVSGTTGNRAGPWEEGRAAQVLRLDFRKTGDTPWRSLASLSWCPHEAFRITGGIANPPFQAALGIKVSWMGADWDQAVRYHRYLGRTWMSGMGFSRSWRGAARKP